MLYSIFESVVIGPGHSEKKVKCKAGNIILVAACCIFIREKVYAMFRTMSCQSAATIMQNPPNIVSQKLNFSELAQNQ